MAVLSTKTSSECSKVHGKSMLHWRLFKPRTQQMALGHNISRPLLLLLLLLPLSFFFSNEHRPRCPLTSKRVNANMHPTRPHFVARAFAVDHLLRTDRGGVRDCKNDWNGGRKKQEAVVSACLRPGRPRVCFTRTAAHSTHAFCLLGSASEPPRVCCSGSFTGRAKAGREGGRLVE